MACTFSCMVSTFTVDPLSSSRFTRAVGKHHLADIAHVKPEGAGRLPRIKGFVFGCGRSGARASPRKLAADSVDHWGEVCSQWISAARTIDLTNEYRLRIVGRERGADLNWRLCAGALESRVGA
jgi:hypothetical protein